MMNKLMSGAMHDSMKHIGPNKKFSWKWPIRFVQGERFQIEGVIVKQDQNCFEWILSCLSKLVGWNEFDGLFGENWNDWFGNWNTFPNWNSVIEQSKLNWYRYTVTFWDITKCHFCGQVPHRKYFFSKNLFKWFRLKTLYRNTLFTVSWKWKQQGKIFILKKLFWSCNPKLGKTVYRREFQTGNYRKVTFHCTPRTSSILSSNWNFAGFPFGC